VKTTVDPTSEAWSRLGLFMSRDVLERRYKALHGGNLTADKAAEIISHLQQGQQYFRSAESAGVLAGPLEQYYGVLALARAIILYRVPRIREANLKRGHGLKAQLPEKSGTLENITLKIEDGSFNELLEATGNIELTVLDEHNLNTSMIPKRWSFVRSLQRPPIETTFSLIDLLSRIPEVRQHFEEAFERPAHCYRGRAALILRSLTLTVRRDRFVPPAPDVLRDALGLSPDWTARATELEGVHFERQIRDGESIADHLPNVVLDVEENHAIVEPFPGGWSLSELGTYVATSHALSMLVRYYPTRWAQLLSHQRGDSILPVLERMRNQIQSQFVRLALWELEREGPKKPT
jgi:hypothetical protein